MSRTPEEWSGQLVGRMHLAGVTQMDLAKELGCTKAYISMILGGIRRPPLARERLEAAFAAVLMKRGEEK